MQSIRVDSRRILHRNMDVVCIVDTDIISLRHQLGCRGGLDELDTRHLMAGSIMATSGPGRTEP